MICTEHLHYIGYGTSLCDKCKKAYDWGFKWGYQVGVQDTREELQQKLVEKLSKGENFVVKVQQVELNDSGNLASS